MPRSFPFRRLHEHLVRIFLLLQVMFEYNRVITKFFYVITIYIRFTRLLNKTTGISYPNTHPDNSASRYQSTNSAWPPR